MDFERGKVVAVPASCWRPAAEPPPEMDLVLIYIPEEDVGHQVWLGYWDGEDWRTDDGFTCGVTWWMCLPPVPELTFTPGDKDA